MRYSKYRNVRTNGSDSKKEAKRKQELQMMERAGKIQDLQYQVEFELIPTQREPDTVGPKGGIKRGKCIEHACKYVADFVYMQNGKKVVEDVKGYRDAPLMPYSPLSENSCCGGTEYGLRKHEQR